MTEAVAVSERDRGDARRGGDAEVLYRDGEQDGILAGSAMPLLLPLGVESITMTDPPRAKTGVAGPVRSRSWRRRYRRRCCRRPRRGCGRWRW